VRAWTATQVVEQSFKDLNKGRLISVKGWNYKLLVFLVRHLPMSVVVCCAWAIEIGAVYQVTEMGGGLNIWQG
jgi:hypothetical protein